LPVLGSNSQYETVIYSYNEFQLNFLLVGGARYFISPALGFQVEGAFGFGSSYYAQAGFVVKLNSSKNSY